MFGVFSSWFVRWFPTRKPGLAWLVGRSCALPATGKPARPASIGHEEALELMGRAAATAGEVAGHVGEHSGNISAINIELAGVQQGDAQAVAAAIRKLLEANEATQRRLEQAELQLQAQQRQLQSVASAACTDCLTGLLNRRTLDEELSRSLADFRRRGRPSALLMVDVDHFKRFNDQHGHVVGDQVLKHVADVLLANSRETDIIARFGGEEFAVVFRGATAAAVRQRSERARMAIGQTAITVEGKPLHVTASAGLTEIQEHDSSVSFLARADAALYSAKHNGRGCTFWNDGQLNVRVELNAPARAAEASAPSEEQRLAVELAAEQFADATFVANISRRIAEWRRGGATFSVVLCRLEGGSDALTVGGERLVREAQRLVCNASPACLRDMDLTTRWLRDGIAILLPGATAPEAIGVARRLRASLEEQEVQSEGQSMSLHLNMGVAEGIEGNDADRVLTRAWQALQSASESSAANIHMHDGVRTRPCIASSMVR
jgi:diguanylate cyclase (GGDEF)-like protein